MNNSFVLVLDFGSQYTQLIARRIRELSIYCEIHPYHISMEKIRSFSPQAIILSGSPASVCDKNAPCICEDIFQMDIPILGICYGAQLLHSFLGGDVEPSNKREFGHASLEIKDKTSLFSGIDKTMKTIDVWMSHSDSILNLPSECRILAQTPHSPIAAFCHKKKPFYGIQFHPEVVHTPQGASILKSFLITVCGCEQNWTVQSFLKTRIRQLTDRIGNEHVICGLSGGVDSSVVAVLLHKAIGKQLTCLFVDNGLLRSGEKDTVMNFYQKNFNMNVECIDAKDLFLKVLRNVSDPERKRKLIGKTFIDVFEKEAKKRSSAKFLAQGTLYPDVIESVSVLGPSVTIKSHHNVGGLPEKMNLQLIEPLRELFKDEVRELGLALGISKMLIWRQPFPGPGLAIRIMGVITEKRLEIVRKADQIVTEELSRLPDYKKIWQSFPVLLPIKTVGVMGDARTYEYVIALRVVESKDGMTAHWSALDTNTLEKLSARLVNELVGVNRIVYDITSKPPSTIEWE